MKDSRDMPFGSSQPVERPHLWEDVALGVMGAVAAASFLMLVWQAAGAGL